jgi:hypothetical protein
VYATVVSKCCRYIATASADRSVKLWDTHAHKEALLHTTSTNRLKQARSYTVKLAYLYCIVYNTGRLRQSMLPVSVSNIVCVPKCCVYMHNEVLR